MSEASRSTALAHAIAVHKDGETMAAHELNGELVARNMELSGRNGRYRALLIRIANALGDSDYRQIAAEINKALAEHG